MSAFEALKAAGAAGIELALEGDDLALTAASELPATVLDALSRHKTEILALLRPGDGWSAEDWQFYFDERAGIAEFEGGLPRREAEAQAFECCVVEWVNRHSLCSPNGRCHRCRGTEVVRHTVPNRPAMPGCIRCLGSMAFKSEGEGRRRPITDLGAG